MKDNTDLIVNLILSVGCLALAIYIWTAIIGFVCSTLQLHPGGAIGAWLVIAVNVVHFFFGAFHVDDDIGDRGLDHGSMGAGVAGRALAILTIGGSKYLRAALEDYRSGKDRD
mgnify:CR=1 FL=1